MKALRGILPTALCLAALAAVAAPETSPRPVARGDAPPDTAMAQPGPGSDEEDLMKKVLDVIYVACDIKSATHQNWKIRNKSVGTGNDQEVNANTLNESNNLIDELKKDLSFYKNKLIGFLKDNEDKFPEYKCSENKEDLNPESKGNNYKSKMSFL